MCWHKVIKKFKSQLRSSFLLLLLPTIHSTVHFSRLSLAHGIEVERAHLLFDIIDKIETAPSGEEYYENVSISYSVKKGEELYKRLQQAGAWP